MDVTRRVALPIQPLLLGVGFLLLIAIGAATLWVVNRSDDDARDVNRTLNVQDRLSNVLLNVRRAETGQRGYLLTDRREYLQDYLIGAPVVLPTVAELRELMSDDPAHKEAVDRIESLSKAKLATLARAIELQDSGNHSAALALVQSDEGRDLMDELRILVGKTTAQQAQLLTERAAASQRNNVVLLVLSLVGTLLILLIGAASIAMVQRNARQREAARDELAVTNANLEHRRVPHRRPHRSKRRDPALRLYRQPRPALAAGQHHGLYVRARGGAQGYFCASGSVDGSDCCSQRAGGRGRYGGADH
jgi:CHASE3 domain sensor protein